MITVNTSWRWIALPGVLSEKDFADRFDLEVTVSGASKQLAPEVRKAIWIIFERGAADLGVENGTAIVAAEATAIETSDYPGILCLLDMIARALDRKPLPVRVLGRELSALVDESGKTRCAYCHSNLTGDEPDLCACEKCRTVVHEACWAEHGGCPLLGCGGSKLERSNLVR
jgi:hypothetical protein